MTTLECVSKNGWDAIGMGASNAFQLDCCGKECNSIGVDEWAMHPARQYKFEWNSQTARIARLNDNTSQASGQTDSVSRVHACQATKSSTLESYLSIHYLSTTSSYNKRSQTTHSRFSFFNCSMKLVATCSSVVVVVVVFVCLSRSYWIGSWLY